MTDRLVSELELLTTTLRVEIIDLTRERLGKLSAVKRAGGINGAELVQFRERVTRMLREITAPAKGGARDIAIDKYAQERLLQRLQNAKDEFVRSDQRSGAELALFAVCDYVGTIQQDRSLARPLEEVLLALVDAKRGVSNPLTAPADYVGGSRKRASEAMRMTMASVAVTLLHDGGVALPIALRRVAAALAPTVSAAEIKEFRKNIQCGRAPEWCIRHYRTDLRLGKVRLQRNSESTPLERADILLRDLRERWGQA